MISSVELSKAQALAPDYLKNLFKLCSQFSNQAQFIRGQGEYITAREIGKLFELGYVIMEEYLSLVNQIKSNEDKLLVQIRNDVFSAFSQFYTKGSSGFVKIDWYKILENEKGEALAEQISSSVLAFIESRIYLPFVQAYSSSMKETVFLNQMINISVRRAGFYPEIEKKPKIESLLGGDDDEDKEEKKSKKKKKGDEEDEK